MKRTIAFILIVVCLMSMLCPFAYARAGGGGGGGGGGRGFFSRATRIYVRNALGETFGSFGYFLYVLIYLLTYAAALICSLIVFISILRARIKSKILLKKLGKHDPVWNPRKLDKHVKDSFYKIQMAWSEQNIYSIRDLLSDSLYEEWSQRIECDIKQNTINVLSDIKLRSSYPVSVQDRIGEENDCIWYRIYASMVDLTYEKSTMHLLSDVKTPTRFVEYWRFCKKDGVWVLDRILQKDEFESLYKKSERPQ